MVKVIQNGRDAYRINVWLGKLDVNNTNLQWLDPRTRCLYPSKIQTESVANTKFSYIPSKMQIVPNASSNALSSILFRKYFYCNKRMHSNYNQSCCTLIIFLLCHEVAASFFHRRAHMSRSNQSSKLISDLYCLDPRLFQVVSFAKVVRVN